MDEGIFIKCSPCQQFEKKCISYNACKNLKKECLAKKSYNYTGKYKMEELGLMEKV